MKHPGWDAAGHILAFHGPHVAHGPCVVHPWIVGYWWWRVVCPFSQSPVMGEERMKPGHWLESVLCATFSALKLLVGWQEGHFFVFFHSSCWTPSHDRELVFEVTCTCDGLKKTCPDIASCIALRVGDAPDKSAELFCHDMLLAAGVRLNGWMQNWYFYFFTFVTMD